jgi:hypothetical protein
LTTLNSDRSLRFLRLGDSLTPVEQGISQPLSGPVARGSQSLGFAVISRRLLPTRERVQQRESAHEEKTQ